MPRRRMKYPEPHKHGLQRTTRHVLRHSQREAKTERRSRATHLRDPYDEGIGADSRHEYNGCGDHEPTFFPILWLKRGSMFQRKHESLITSFLLDSILNRGINARWIAAAWWFSPRPVTCPPPRSLARQGNSSPAPHPARWPDTLGAAIVPCGCAAYPG